MAKIVNKHGAPKPFIKFCKDDKYDAGRSDYSATTLINEPRIVALERQHPELIVDDPSENPFKFLSSNWHELLSRYTDDGVINEERVFSEIETPKGTVTISGAMDVQEQDGENITITDYKMTSVYSLNDTDKWEAQQNIYANLIEKEKPNVKVEKIQVYAFLRDWKISMSEKLSSYPGTPGVVVPLDLWSFEERESYILARIKKHQAAKEELPECSREGRWPAGKIYRVVSTSGIHPTKLFRLKREATGFIATLDPVDSIMSKIETTNETFRRCKSYCYVSKVCKQWEDWQSANE